MDEIGKIKERYAMRKENMAAPTRGDEYFTRCSRREKREYFAAILKRHFHDDFRHLSMMEIGAGTGQNIDHFLELGFRSANIWANELLEDRFLTLKENFPGIHADPGNASLLPYRNQFDLVFQSTVFTSILDEGLKKDLARTMFNMAKPGGLILWYDIAFDNPFARHIKPIGKKEVIRLFPDASSIAFHRTTLFHPIGRRVFGMYKLITFAFPFLRSHVIAEIYK